MGIHMAISPHFEINWAIETDNEAKIVTFQESITCSYVRYGLRGAMEIRGSNRFYRFRRGNNVCPMWSGFRSDLCFVYRKKTWTVQQ
jgi:hypothetical protein